MTRDEFDQLWMIVSMLPGVRNSPDREDLAYAGVALLRSLKTNNGRGAILALRELGSPDAGINYMSYVEEEPYDDVLRDVLEIYRKLRERPNDPI